MTRRLLIVDGYQSPAFDRLGEELEPSDTCDVLLLGLSVEWFQRRYAERLSSRARWRVIDPAPLADAACRWVSRFVVEFIPRLPHLDLGGTTLASLLDQPEGTDWWFMETSEKGPYRGPLIGQLYRLALVRLALDRAAYDEVWYCLSEAALVEVFNGESSVAPRWIEVPCAPRSSARLATRPLIRYWAQAARAAVGLIVARMACRPLSGFTPPAGAEFTFTVFPAWWSDPWGTSPRDRFFSLQAATGRRGYLAWLTEPLILWRHGPEIARAFVALGIVPLQGFARVRDLLSLFSPWRFRRVLTFEWRLRQRLCAEFAGFAIQALIGRDVSRSLSGAEPFQDMLLQRCTARASGAMKPSRVLYRAEFQPIEHALLRGLEAARSAVPIGFVHFPFGERYLSMRFSADDVAAIGGRSGDRSRRPMPDGIIAIGPAAARHAIEGGYPSSRVAVCGPQRYGNLVHSRRARQPREALRRRLGLPTGRFAIFVALAILEADTEALSAALAMTAAELDDVLLIVRTHPNQPRAPNAIDILLSNLGDARARLMPAAGDLYDFICASDLMVCIGSMIAFEAMALDVMPIVFENPSTFAATSLAEFEAGLFVVRSGSELIDAIGAARADSERARRKRLAWPRMLEDVFGDFDRPLDVQMHEAIASIEGAHQETEGGRAFAGRRVM